MNDILTIFELSGLTYLIVNAEPIIILKNKLGIDTDSENKYNRFIARLLDCCLCTGFWFGLIVTQNLLIAGGVSVLAEYISKQIKF